MTPGTYACGICDSEAGTRHVAIYAFGSEGVCVCEACGRALAETVRAMRSAANRRQNVALKAEVARLKALGCVSGASTP